MDRFAVLIVSLAVALLVVYGTAIAGSIDALSQPRDAWGRAGCRRSRWVWQAFGLLCVPAAVGYSGVYFVRVRPRLLAAARELAIERDAALARLRPTAVAAGMRGAAITIRMPLWIGGAYFLSVLLGSSVGFGIASLDAPSGASFPWWILIPWTAGALFGAAGWLAHGVTLTAHGVVTSGLPSRHVAWPDVVAITRQSSFGSLHVRLWTRTGRSRRLRAPSTFFGVGRRRFEADFSRLEQRWAAHVPVSD